CLCCSITTTCAQCPHTKETNVHDCDNGSVRNEDGNDEDRTYLFWIHTRGILFQPGRGGGGSSCCFAAFALALQEELEKCFIKLPSGIIIPQPCVHVAYPHHPQEKGRRACNAPLLKNFEVRGKQKKRVFWRPIKT